MDTREEMNRMDASAERYADEFKRFAREHLRDYVESVTTPVPRFGNNAYICPCCASGSGRNNHYTPAFFLFRHRDGYLAFKCHSCGESGDIFKLAGLMNEEPSPDRRRSIIAAFFGIDLQGQTPLSGLVARDSKITAIPSLTDIMKRREAAQAYITECRKHVDETDYFRKRGLSAQTISDFKLGFDPETQRAVIPFSSDYYVSRSIRIGADMAGVKKHLKPSGLRQPLFNLTALLSPVVFVTEAPLDALSIIEAGGAAIALGGTSTAAFTKVLDVYRPTGHFILALDNDKAGLQARTRIESIMDARDIAFSSPTTSSLVMYKDANAALMDDPRAFARDVRHEIGRAENAVTEPEPVPRSAIWLPRRSGREHSDSKTQSTSRPIELTR